MGATFPNEMRPSVVLEAASTWVVNGSILGFSKSFGATGSNPEGMDEPTATSTPDIIQIPSTAACGRCGPSHGGSCASPPPHPYPPAAFPSLPLPLAAAALRMHGGSCASPPPNPSTCCLPPPTHTHLAHVCRETPLKVPLVHRGVHAVQAQARCQLLQLLQLDGWKEEGGEIRRDEGEGAADGRSFSVRLSGWWGRGGLQSFPGRDLSCEFLQSLRGGK